MAAMLLMAFVLITVVVACGEESTSKEASTTTSVENSGWRGTSLLCSGDIASAGAEVSPLAQELIDLGSGALMSLGDDPASSLAAAGCTEASGVDRPAPTLSPGASYFAIGTGVDRNDVALTGVNSVDYTVEGMDILQVELNVPGPDCMTTMEYRGRLILLLVGPAGAEKPLIEYNVVEVDC